MGKAYEKLKKESEESGYFLNNDVEFVEMLINNIDVNIERYGYGACPCRLASGVREEDLDIICPCDYRDIDLNEYGFCFCGLYITKDVLNGKKEVESIPDRRFKEKENITPKSGFKYPVFRCKVCGYLCSRKEPPETCPICKVDKDRFEKVF